jgi:hypothetical protein
MIALSIILARALRPRGRLLLRGTGLRLGARLRLGASLRLGLSGLRGWCGLHLSALGDIRSALRRHLGSRRRLRWARLGRRRLWLLSLPIFRSWLCGLLLHLRVRLRLEAAVVARGGFPFASRGPRSGAMGTDHIGCIEDGGPRRRGDRRPAVIVPFE